MEKLEVTLEVLETKELSSVSPMVSPTDTVQQGDDSISVLACCCCCCC